MKCFLGVVICGIVHVVGQIACDLVLSIRAIEVGISASARLGEGEVVKLRTCSKRVCWFCVYSGLFWDERWMSLLIR